MSEKKEHIERGALIAAMHKQTEQYHLRVAMELPAADVEPVVRGEWREMRDPYGDLQGWIHEECGRTTDEACDRCPKCGAHMSMERSGSGE